MDKSIETKNRLIVTWGWVKQGREIGKVSDWLLTGTGFLSGVLKNYGVLMASQLHKYTKNH